MRFPAGRQEKRRRGKILSGALCGRRFTGAGRMVLPTPMDLRDRQRSVQPGSVRDGTVQLDQMIHPLGELLRERL
jgi:hypothetical protein